MNLPHIIEKTDFIDIETHNSLGLSIPEGVACAIDRILVFLIKEQTRPESLKFDIKNMGEINEQEHKYKYTLCWTLRAEALDENTWIDYCRHWFKQGGFRLLHGIPDVNAPREFWEAIGFLRGCVSQNTTKCLRFCLTNKTNSVLNW